MRAYYTCHVFQVLAHSWKSFAGIVVLAILAGCTEQSDPEFEKENFTSIFDHSHFSAAFYPVDFKQTADGGYLILAERKIPESQFSGIYILKADARGNFVKELAIDNQYVNPVGELMPVNGAYYFAGMDASNLQAVLMKVDVGAAGVEITPLAGMTYPAAAAVDGNGLLLLSYNHVDRTSVISGHALTGQISRGPKQFSIGAGDDVAEPIMNHFIRTGKRFPFQVGKVSEGLYFFNGFENYTFSLVFTDLQEDEPLGVVQGQHDDGGFSAVLSLGDNQVATSRFNFGENYFLPRIALETNGPTVGALLGGHPMPELVPDAPVRILRSTLGVSDVLVFAGDTRSKQIGLFFYDASSGEFISSRYLGFSNPFEIAALIQTEDEGLAVCGVTFLAGRFPRICLFKISADEVRDHVE